MLTSKDNVFDRARAKLLGADEYLTKPFTRDSLLNAVATYACKAAS
jgi:twitching motility two-component system response regulator PilG